MTAAFSRQGIPRDEDHSRIALNEENIMNTKLMLMVSAAFMSLPSLAYSQCPNTFVWLDSTHLVAGATPASFLKGLEVPPGFRIKEVVVCAPLPVASVAINRPSGSIPLPLTPTGAAPCLTYGDPANPPIDPNDPLAGPATVALELSADPVSLLPAPISSLGLNLTFDPTLWGYVAEHEHHYRTGRGRGHNKVQAVTEPVPDDCPAETGASGTPSGGGNDDGSGNGSSDGGGNGNGSGNGNGNGNGKGKGKGNDDNGKGKGKGKNDD